MFMQIEKERMSVFASIQMQGKKGNDLWEKDKFSLLYGAKKNQES